VNGPEAQLKKILDLEQRKGFSDRAVIGGLDRFLARARETRDLSPSSAVMKSIMALPADGYASLSVEQRRRWASQALALLEELHALTGRTPYLFPKAKGYGDADVISENTVGKLLNNLGYQGRQCVHGFRASARSILSEQGWSVEAMERQLDHKEANGTVAAYARSQHLPERRRMMQAWADTCDVLEAEAEASPHNGGQNP